MKNTNEEWDQVDPYNTEDDKFWVKVEHLGRYLLAADYLSQFQPQVVADIACGIGYGIPEINRAANSIIAVDNSKEMLESASKHYGNSKVTFIEQDIDTNQLVDAIGVSSVDAIISFETIEHLLNPIGAIEQFSRLLKPEGHLICSVPNVLYEPLWPIKWGGAGLPANQCHTQLFNFHSFSQMLNKYGFVIKYRVGQSWTNILFRRESELGKNGAVMDIGSKPELQTPEMIRYFAHLVGYPTVEAVDGSYSIIIIAQKMYFDNKVVNSTIKSSTRQ